MIIPRLLHGVLVLLSRTAINIWIAEAAWASKRGEGLCRHCRRRSSLVARGVGVAVLVRLAFRAVVS